MRPHPIAALRSAAQARRAARRRDHAITAAAHDTRPATSMYRASFRSLPVYRAACAATGVSPARTVLPDLPDVLARLDALAAPLYAPYEPLVSPALLANAVAGRAARLTGAAR